LAPAWVGWLLANFIAGSALLATGAAATQPQSQRPHSVLLLQIKKFVFNKSSSACRYNN
jgi:hypothetical protein